MLWKKKLFFIIQTNIKKLRCNKISRKTERKGHLYDVTTRKKKNHSKFINSFKPTIKNTYNFLKQDLYVELSRNNIRQLLINSFCVNSELDS